MDRRQMLMIAAGSFALKAQTPASKEFEVASIKPSAPQAMGMMRVGVEMLPGGRVSMTGVSVKFLIQQAYGVRDFQIAGGPGWIGSDRYDITAKPETASTGDQVKTMIQALLADRFKLKFHRETKELPTYALVVAKGGPKLHASEVQDKGSENRRGTQIRMMRGQFDVQDAPMAALANQLGQVLGRSVIDKTELTGNYDFKLEWTPDESEGGMFRGAEAHPEARPEGPSLMTALQEQLGLKLDSTKGPVEILTIDRVEKPSEN
jgi:bla regulator protein blaR1